MKNEEIGTILRQGRAYKSSSFLFKYVENMQNMADNKPINKDIKVKLSKSTTFLPEFAYLAPKKLFKTAVLRNKARRKIKAAMIPFLKIFNKNKANKAFFGVFTLNPQVFTTSVGDISNEIENIMKKSGMLNT